jgi:hypothetical protein
MFKLLSYTEPNYNKHSKSWGGSARRCKRHCEVFGRNSLDRVVNGRKHLSLVHQAENLKPRAWFL